MTNPEFDQGGEIDLLRQQEIFHEKVYLNEKIINVQYSKEELTSNFLRGVSDHLDEQCPYIGRAVFISGRALIPEFDEETHVLSGERWEFVDYVGLHLGVSVVANDEDDSLLILQQIYIGEMTDAPLNTVLQHIKFFAYFENNANISLLEELEGAFTPTQVGMPHAGTDTSEEELMSKLIIKSEQFRDILLGKRFRSLSALRQNSFIEKALQVINGTIPLIGSDVGVEAQYGYVPELCDDGSVDYQVLDLSHMSLYGRCLRIDTIEAATLDTGPIRKLSEFIDKTAGLQLVLDPDEDTRGSLDVSEDKVLFIPTASQPVYLEVIEQ